MNQKTEERKPISLDKKGVTTNHSYIDKTTGQRVCKPVGSVEEEVYPKVAEQRVVFPQGNIRNEDGTPVEQEEPKEQKVVHPTKTIGEERVDKSKKGEKRVEDNANLDNYYGYGVTSESTKEIGNIYVEYIKRKPLYFLTITLSVLYIIPFAKSKTGSFFIVLLLLYLAFISVRTLADIAYLAMPVLRVMLPDAQKENMISQVARDLADEQDRQGS